MKKIFIYLASVLCAAAVSDVEAYGLTENEDSVEILGVNVHKDALNPVTSGVAPLTNAIDTLDTVHPDLKVILFNNNTWEYYNVADSSKLSDVYTRNWVIQSINPYCEPLDSLPQTWSVWLVNSLSSYHCPVDGKLIITSKFGPRRGRLHQGIDIGIPMNTPLHAVFDGTVRTATDKFSGYGNVVIIRHDNGLETVYAHMNSMDVVPGDHVKAGDQIGFSGNTGRSTGPHLHFEIRYHGYALDPSRVIDFSYGNLRQRIMVLKRRYFDANSIVDQNFDDEFRNKEDDEKELAEMKKKAAEEARKRAEKAAVWHTVKSGECLGTIAKKYHTSVDAIVKLNKNTIKNKSNIRIGAKIRVK